MNSELLFYSLAGLDISQLQAHWALSEKRLADLVNNGVFKPLLLRYVLLFVAPSICALLVSRRSNPSVRYIRWLAFIWTTGFGIWIMRTCRTIQMGNGHVVGTAIVQFIYRSGTMLVTRDPETEFRRLERKWAAVSKDPSALHKGEDVLVWQSYPDGLIHRLSWVGGLLASHRGSCWNWRIKTSEPMPKLLLDQLEKRPAEPLRVQMDWTLTRRFMSVLGELTKNCLYLLLVKFLILRDAYYWGDIHADWRVTIVSWQWSFPASSFPAFACRSLVGIWATKCFLSSIHQFLIITCLAISIVFPNAAHIIFRVPVNEPWMTPSAFGPHESVLYDGLRGWWGTFWHQFLRYDFLSWSSALRSLLPAHIRKSPMARCLTFVVAWLMTTTLHIGGSYMVFGETRSLTWVGRTYLVHFVGFLVQSIWALVVFPRLRLGHFPPGVYKTANVLTTWWWMMFTGKYVFQNYAVGGVFASIVRMMSF